MGGNEPQAREAKCGHDTAAACSTLRVGNLMTGNQPGRQPGVSAAAGSAAPLL